MLPACVDTAQYGSLKRNALKLGYLKYNTLEDGKYFIMANGNRAVAIRSGDAPEHTAPEKKPSIREWLEDAKRECAERKAPD